MVDTSLNQETIDVGASTVGGTGGGVVGLTLLLHPNLARVGQVSALFSLGIGGVRRLSRLETEFHWHGDEHGEPLATPVLSRTPIMIRATDQRTLSIENPSGLPGVKLQGRALSASCEVSEAELTRGVVIALSGCVLLLLHWLSADRDIGPDLGLFGESLEMRRVREEIRRVADLDSCVLIRGESGSGKELVARAIHSQSRRNAGPYVPVNMGAVPSLVGASLLFGHARGAFTGAASQNPGFFGSAEGGTLFLDEIGETPRDLQALLLRVLREGEIQPVGEPRPRKVNVRVLSATDADLEAMVDRGQFAMPLLRRLEGYTIAVPALRRRRDDLARLFLRALRRELESTGESFKLDEPQPSHKPWLPASLVTALLDYDWPGNVAELETIAKRVAITNREGKEFYLDPTIPERLALRRPSAPLAGGVPARFGPPEPAPKPGPDAAHGAAALRTRDSSSIEDAEIARVMREHRFQINAVAVALGVSRSWLNKRLERCHGVRKAKELSREEILAAFRGLGEDLSALAGRLEVSEHGLKLRMKALDIPLDR